MTPEDVFSELHRAADAACGARLFTVTVLDRAAGLACRTYSSHPEDYPVTGTKPMKSNPWFEQVIGRGESFVANETAGFSPFFADHALINALGCESAMNIPVSDGEQVVGTVNILDEAGHFTPDRVAALQALVDANRAKLLTAFAEITLEDAS